MCTGGELFDKITQEKKFTEQKAAKYMHDIIYAVAYCHNQGIIHRDLKPDNLLLIDKSEDAALKVIDFGTGIKMTNDNKVKQVIGTIYYMAPEVFTGNYDEKCDIWSCGVILYIMLCNL